MKKNYNLQKPLTNLGYVKTGSACRTNNEGFYKLLELLIKLFIVSITAVTIYYIIAPNKNCRIIPMHDYDMRCLYHDNKEPMCGVEEEID